MPKTKKVKICCSQCICTFTAKANLQRHIRRFHPKALKELESVCKVTCGVCGKHCISIFDLHNHLETDHSHIKLLHENRVFYSIEQFDQWKLEIERESKFTFTKLRADKQLCDGRFAINYFCNMHRKRTQCPAHISATKEVHDVAVEIHVKYQATHVHKECDFHIAEKNDLVSSGIKNDLDLEPISVCVKLDLDRPTEVESGVSLCNIASDPVGRLKSESNQVCAKKAKPQKDKCKFHCSYCRHCTFTTKNNLNRHVKKFHSTVLNKQNHMFHVACCICEKICKSINDLHDHFKTEHAYINLSFRKEIFYSIEQFEQWKSEVEQASQTTFVRHLGDKKLKDGRIAMSFYCNQTKHHGNDQKTGFLCPSHITVHKEMHDVAVEIKVNYQSTHVGHCDESQAPTSKIKLDSDSGMVVDSLTISSDGVEFSSENHESDTEMLEENKNRFGCSLCVCTFTTKHNLRRHIRKFHPTVINNLMPASHVKCGNCGIKCRSIIELHSHFKIDHTDVKLAFEKSVFYSMDDFQQWKLDIERQSQAMFIKRRADRVLSDGRIAINFFCHRSGYYEPKKDRQRRVKSVGTQKIGFSCPAHITAYKDTHEDLVEIEVEYQSVHVGHKCEVGRLPLSKIEKEILAECLRKGIPKSTVLKNIRKEFSSMTRISLTTRQDLINICRDFKINNEIAKPLPENEPTTIEDCDKDVPLQTEEENPVVIFLQHFPYGIHEEQPETEVNFDCALSIMTSDYNECHPHEYRVVTSDQAEPTEETPTIEEERAVVVSELQNLFTTCESPLVSAEQLRLLRDGISALKSKLAATSTNINIINSVPNKMTPQSVSESVTVQHPFPSNSLYSNQ